MDENIVLNDISLFYLEASEYINENIIDLGDDHQLFLEEEKKGFWAKVWDGIKKFFQTIWNWIKKAWNWLFGKANDPGKIEKILLEYKKILQSRLNELKKVLDNKDNAETDEAFKIFIFRNTCPTYNWDLENSEIIHNFKVTTKEGQRILNIIRDKAKIFVNKKLTLKNMNIPNKSNSDKILEDNLSMSFEAKWNYLNAIKELIENQLTFYENDNDMINVVYLIAINNITIYLVNLYLIVRSLIGMIKVIIDNKESKEKRLKLLENISKLLLGNSDLSQTLNFEISMGEIFVTLKFYQMFGFINASQYEKLFSSYYKKNRLNSFEYIEQFKKNNGLSSEETKSSEEPQPLILQNQGNSYDEYKLIQEWIDGLFHKGVSQQSQIDELEKAIKSQNEIPQEKIMSVLSEITGLNKFLMELFNNTSAYYTLNKQLIDVMITDIKKFNL